jgi:hypothetical protein
MPFGYRIDIDGTVGEPKFVEGDFWETARLYIEAGIATETDVQALRSENQQRLWLLPHVLLTHVPLPGAVAGVEQFAQSGSSLSYFTVRQALETEVCRQVHENTRVWLNHQRFPHPNAVEFFWDVSEKLTKSLEAPEEQIVLIDDRIGGLLHAYQRIAEHNPTQAEEIERRVSLVAFGADGMKDLPQVEHAPSVFSLEDWFHLNDLFSWIQERFRESPPVVPSAVRST